MRRADAAVRATRHPRLNNPRYRPKPERLIAEYRPAPSLAERGYCGNVGGRSDPESTEGEEAPGVNRAWFRPTSIEFGAHAHRWLGLQGKNTRIRADGLPKILDVPSTNGDNEADANRRALCDSGEGVRAWKLR